MTSSLPDFAPISSEEMGFALTLFVQTANQRIALPAMPDEVLLPEREEVYAHLFSLLCADISPSLAAPARSRRSGETTLYAAFKALCSFYEGDSHQVAICARVLAFYFLMERSAGEALADWTEPSAEHPELVGLHPAVLDALGTVSLHGSIALSASDFRDLISELASPSENTPARTQAAAVLH